MPISPGLLFDWNTTLTLILLRCFSSTQLLIDAFKLQGQGLNKSHKERVMSVFVYSLVYPEPSTRPVNIGKYSKMYQTIESVNDKHVLGQASGQGWVAQRLRLYMDTYRIPQGPGLRLILLCNPNACHTAKVQ